MTPRKVKESERRLRPLESEPGVWIGPEWFADSCRPPSFQKHGPRIRIFGRWLPALRASRLLFCTFHINSRKKSRTRRLDHMRWIVATRAKLNRWDECPF